MKINSYIRRKIKYVWSDPVWSKVISAIIISIISLIYFQAIEFNYTDFFKSLSVFMEQEIKINFFFLFMACILNSILIWQIIGLVKNQKRITNLDPRKKIGDLIVSSELGLMHYCQLDKQVQDITINKFESLDQSNLYYCLVNVYDGEEAEILFTSLICRKFKIDIVGAYAIMGKWDLLLKFRYAGKTKIAEVINIYEKELDKKGLLYKKNSFNSIDISNRIVFYDVVKEINPFQHYIERRFLHNTENYLKTRSQRRFIFIELHRDQKIDFIQQFVTHLEQHEQLRSIIEFFSICRNDVILNLFMRCSQTSILILLNNAIEDFLQDKDLNVVKHTFICYTFNEPLLIQTKK